MNFLRLIALITSLVTFSVCSVEQKQLYGTWGHSDDDGATFWGFEKVTSEGVTSWGKIPEFNETYSFESSFQYDESSKKLCFTITKSNDPLMPIGEQFCNIIQKVENNKLYYLNSSNKERVMFKQHG